RIHAGHVVHHDADLAPVLRNPGLPLRVRQTAREAGERAGPVLESIGEGIGTFAHCFYLWLMGCESMATWYPGWSSGDSSLDVEIFSHHRRRAVGGNVVLLEQPSEPVTKPAGRLGIRRAERRHRGSVTRGEELGDGRGWKREAKLQRSQVADEQIHPV